MRQGVCEQASLNKSCSNQVVFEQEAHKQRWVGRSLYKCCSIIKGGALQWTEISAPGVWRYTDFQLTFIVLSAGRRRGLRFGLSLLSAFVYSLVRCSSSVGCCFADATSPCPRTLIVLYPELSGRCSDLIHVGSHPLAPGDASCCLAYVAVLDLFVISTSSARRSPEDSTRT